MHILENMSYKGAAPCPQSILFANVPVKCIFQCAECACLLGHACDYKCININLRVNAHGIVNMPIVHIEICN